MHDVAQDDLCSVTEAANRLCALGDRVDRSSLSRYVSNHADALEPTKRGRETLVAFEKLRQHRSENIRLDQRPASASGSSPLGRSKLDSQARKVSAEAQLRELEVAREMGLVTPVAEVVNGAHAAIAALRAAIDLAINDTAESMAAQLGVEARLVRPFLRRLASKAQQQFACQLTNAAPGDNAAVQAQEPTH